MSSSNIDALPYYDNQVEDAATTAAAKALIAAELRDGPKASDDPRIPADVDVFPKSTHLNELLENYKDQPIRGIDPSRYSVDVAEDADVEALIEAEKRGRINEGHMALRLENTQILAAHGPNAWLVRNYQLNSQLTELQSTLAQLKDQVTEVNRQRRVYQEDTGNHLSRLEGRWKEVTIDGLQLELATQALEGELRSLRRKEDDLREEVRQLEQQQA